MNTKCRLALATLAVAVLSSLAIADTPAADYHGGGTVDNWSNATGFWFSVNQNVTVTGVGFYDLSGSGLATSHAVGIFKEDGTLVVSGTVDAGTVDPYLPGTVGGTRVKPVSPTALTAGQTYYCLADNLATDSYVYGIGAVTFDSALRWLSYGDMQSNNIFTGIPSRDGGQAGNLAGTFTFAVPEPVSAICFLMAVPGLALARRRSA